MRGAQRCALLAALLAVAASAPVGSASRAEEALEASPPGGSEAREAAPDATPERRARQRGARPRPEEWWAHAREVLLSDLALREDQLREVDAIIERQLAARQRNQELRSDLRDARRQGDGPRSAALQSQLRANRAQFRAPDARLGEIRALLTEQQRPTFDMNRARLVAETQQLRDAQKRRRTRRSPADAKAKTEE